MRKPVQKLSGDTVLIWAPCLSWMRICELTTVIIWFGPTAPALSGVRAVPSPDKPGKLAEAGGEEVGENAVAEKELVVTRLAGAHEAVFSGEPAVELVELSVAELVVVVVRSGLVALCEGL